jgi:hypothetical protein
MGMGLTGLGRHRDALSYYERAVAMARRVNAGQRHIWVALCAKCNLELGQPKPAVTLLEEAIKQIEDLRNAATALTERDRASFFRRLKDFDAYDHMIRAQRMLGRDAEALSYLEQARARSLLDTLDRSRFDPVAEMRKQADDTLLAQIESIRSRFREADAEVARLNHLLTKQKTDEHKARLKQASRRRDTVLREHAQLVQKHVRVARPADAESLQLLAGERGRVLVYSVTEQGTILFHVPPPGAAIKSYTLAVTAEDLADKVGRYAAQVRAKEGLARGIAPSSKARASMGAGGHALFRALVPAEVWRDVKKARIVYVVADRALHGLAFETLVVDPQKRRFWLDEGPPIAYGSSGSALLWSRERRNEQARQPRLEGFVAIGDPVYGAGTAVARSRYGALRRLPGTRREVETIASSLKGLEVTTLMGEQATRTALRDAAPRARYLHIATHGIGDETSGASYSSLALTSPPEPTAEDDGFLKLSDLLARWRGKLRGCELVVLSACETQTGHVQKDEAVMALPIGFLFAGAPSVIASLWRVDDQRTADLMVELYRHLGRGDGKLEAFTKARKALRERHPEPYHWAPFIYIGDPR